MEITEMCSAEITKLASAMIKVQTMLQPAIRDRNNTFTKSDYATLNSVMDVCRQPLLENGIWLTQYPVPVQPGYLGLVTKFIHAESGQWQASLLSMPLPKADPQGYGSAMTYARRYILSAMLGIVTEYDDAANAAREGEQNEREKAPPKRPRPKKARPEPQVIPPPQPDEPAHPVLKSLPKLDGISYQVVSSKDGQACIIAEGKTRAKEKALEAAGFVWSDKRHTWWRYAEAA